MKQFNFRTRFAVEGSLIWYSTWERKEAPSFDDDLAMSVGFGYYSLLYDAISVPFLKAEEAFPNDWSTHGTLVWPLLYGLTENPSDRVFPCVTLFFYNFFHHWPGEAYHTSLFSGAGSPFLSEPLASPHSKKKLSILFPKSSFPAWQEWNSLLDVLIVPSSVSLGAASYYLCS